MRNGAVIPGQTSLTYTVTSADITKVLTLRVTGSKSGYTQHPRDEQRDHRGAAPVVDHLDIGRHHGDRSGRQRAPGDGSDLDPAGRHLGLPWLRDGSPIPAQTALTYTVTATDIGKVLSLRVTGSKSGYTDTVVTSNGIAGVPLPSLTTSTPAAISGSGQVGSTLQWPRPDLDRGRRRRDVPVAPWRLGHRGPGRPGLPRHAYRPGAACSAFGSPAARAAGATLSWPATGFKPRPAPRRSRRWLPVSPGRPPSAARCRPRRARGPSPRRRVQWRRNGAAIAGATGSSYTLAPLDAAQQITVLVTASAPGHLPGSAASAPVTVAKASSTTAAVLAKKTVPAGKAAKLVVTVKAPGSPGPPARSRSATAPR